jgi:hypothetical protein
MLYCPFRSPASASKRLPASAGEIPKGSSGFQTVEFQEGRALKAGECLYALAMGKSSRPLVAVAGILADLRGDALAQGNVRRLSGDERYRSEHCSATYKEDRPPHVFCISECSLLRRTASSSPSKLTSLAIFCVRSGRRRRRASRGIAGGIPRRGKRGQRV